MCIKDNTFIYYFFKYTSFVSMSIIMYIEPDRAVKENMRCVNVNLIRSNKSLSEKKEYVLKLMEHCALVNCWNLLSTFAYRKNLNVSTQFQSSDDNCIFCSVF